MVNFKSITRRLFLVACFGIISSLVGSTLNSTPSYALLIGGPDADHRAAGQTYLVGGSAVRNTGGAAVALRTYVNGVQQNLTAIAISPRYVVATIHANNRTFDSNSPTGIAANASIEISIGSNAQTNRVAIYQVTRVINFPGTGVGTNLADYVVLDLGSNRLPIRAARLGVVAWYDTLYTAGFGSFAVPNGTGFRDYNVRGGWAPVLGGNGGVYNPELYREAIFDPAFISGLNVRGMAGDSGSPWFNGNGELVGMTVAGTNGTGAVGRTSFLRFDNPTIRANLLPYTLPPVKVPVVDKAGGLTLGEELVTLISNRK